MGDSRVRVALKYCGSCNPTIDLSKVGRELREAIGKDDRLVLVSPYEDSIDAMVILCGCPRACGDKEELRTKAPFCIVSAAGMVNKVSVPESSISVAILEKLKSVRKG